MNAPDRLKDPVGLLSEPRPSRDWLLLLAVSFLVFLVLSAYAAYLFFSVQHAPPLASAASGGFSVTRGDIEQTLGVYRTRQLNYEARNFPAPAVVDPSR